MKKFLAALFVLVPGLALSAGGDVHLDKAHYDLTDKASLQNGAKLFMNYCLGCHQQQYQRYQSTFEDLGIPLELGQENLQFTGDKVSSYITNTMKPANAEKWFGAAIPDLTLVARVRGADWLYTYLRSFYADPKRPMGVNNLVFKDVGMPHVLQELQGRPVLAHEEAMVDGEKVERYAGIKAEGGLMTAEQYDAAVLDLVNYLVYVGEPGRLDLEHKGKFVLGFIIVLFIFVYLLKKEYWREVH